MRRNSEEEEEEGCYLHINQQRISDATMTLFNFYKLSLHDSKP
jgi:hypothetical protein